MSITKRSQAVIGGVLAGLGILLVTASPSLAHNYNQSPLSTTPFNSTMGTQPTQEQANQMMSQCTSMMSRPQNRQGRMGNGNTSGMMDGQTRQSGQDRMNRTTVL